MDDRKAALFAGCLGVLFALGASAAPGSPPSGAKMAHPECPMAAGMDGASPGMHAHSSGRGADRWTALITDLDLTAEQRQSIQQVFEQFRTRAAAFRERAMRMRERFEQVEPDDPRYAATSAALADDAGSMASEMALLMSEMRAEVHAVLNPEQRARLRQRSDAERQRWDEWRLRHRAEQPANP